MKFWDSSAIIPLLLQEKTSVAARSLLKSQGSITVWWGTLVECSSAISRVERLTQTQNKDIARANQQLRELASTWNEVQPIMAIREIAQRLLRVHTLRAPDALQLAAALAACNQRPSSTDFICLDQRLSLAAAREGFNVISF